MSLIENSSRHHLVSFAQISLKDFMGAGPMEEKGDFAETKRFLKKGY